VLLHTWMNVQIVTEI